jgi:hypothetical protein
MVAGGRLKRLRLKLAPEENTPQAVSLYILENRGSRARKRRERKKRDIPGPAKVL